VEGMDALRRVWDAQPLHRTSRHVCAADADGAVLREEVDAPAGTQAPPGCGHRCRTATPGPRVQAPRSGPCRGSGAGLLAGPGRLAGGDTRLRIHPGLRGRCRRLRTMRAMARRAARDVPAGRRPPAPVRRPPAPGSRRPTDAAAATAAERGRARARVRLPHQATPMANHQQGGNRETDDGEHTFHIAGIGSRFRSLSRYAHGPVTIAQEHRQSRLRRRQPAAASVPPIPAIVPATAAPPARAVSAAQRQPLPSRSPAGAPSGPSGSARRLPADEPARDGRARLGQAATSSSSPATPMSTTRASAWPSSAACSRRRAFASASSPSPTWQSAEPLMALGDRTCSSASPPGIWIR